MSYKYTIGRECEEFAIGRSWKFSKFTRKVWEELAREGRRLLPDPVAAVLDLIDDVTAKDAESLRRIQEQDAAEEAAAKAERRPPNLIAPLWTPLSSDLVDKAYQSKVRYLSAGSPELNGFIASNEGQAFLFYLLLKKHQPDIDAETAYEVYWDLYVNSKRGQDDRDGRMTVDEIIKACNGISPEPAKKKPLPDSSTQAPEATPDGLQTGPT